MGAVAEIPMTSSLSERVLQFIHWGASGCLGSFERFEYTKSSGLAKKRSRIFFIPKPIRQAKDDVWTCRLLILATLKRLDNLSYSAMRSGNVAPNMRYLWWDLRIKVFQGQEKVKSTDTKRLAMIRPKIAELELSNKYLCYTSWIPCQ